MYAGYFGLTESPFSIAPDPRYLYMSASHREAIAHLFFGLEEGGGFVQLTGEVGTGKTTLCRCFLAQLPDTINVALIVNPRIDERELLEAICDELQIVYPPVSTIKDLQSRLNNFLLEQHAQGRHTLLVIDESQNLSRKVLEQIRLLTNLETEKKKLLQIVLIGQTELATLLQSPDLRQVAQRITARYHLTPLNAAEVRHYIKHRVSIAGRQETLFTKSAVRTIHRLSKGIPRLVNIFCDRALLGAYAQNQQTVSAQLVRGAAREVSGNNTGAWYRRPAVWFGVLALALMIPFSQAFTATSLKNLLGLSAIDDGEGATPIVLAQALADSTQSNSAVRQDPPATETGITHSETLAKVDSSPIPLLDQFEVPSQQIKAINIEGDSEKDTSQTGERHMDWLTFLSNTAATADRGTMLKRLVSLWGRPAAIVSNCDSVKEVGLNCVTRNGDISSIAKLNRSCLVELKLDDDVIRYAVLRRVNGTIATLVLAEQEYSLPLAELDALWTGRFTLLWRPPPLQEIGVTQFSSPDDIRWLRRALNIVAANNGGSMINNPDSGTFDDLLRERIIEFQRHHQLADSGIAGVDTLITMNSLLHHHSVPVLTN